MTEPDESLDFTGMSEDDIQCVFGGLPEEEKAVKLAEMLHDELVDAKKVSDFIRSVGKYTEIAIRVLTRVT